MTVKQQKAIKKVKGFSSAYPNMCNLKLLPNVDGTWITIRDDVGTLMTVKLSDLNDYVHYVLEDLPSDTPKEKTGYWIDDKFGSKCSRCGMYTHLDKFDRPMKFKYCSMCGAKMHKSDVVERSKIDKAIAEVDKRGIFVVPTDATNGDMLKAMFPKYYQGILSYLENSKWWKSPYKKEV